MKNTHPDKSQASKGLSVANKVSQKQSGGESTFQFVDNRPEAVAQIKLQEMANNSPLIRGVAQSRAKTAYELSNVVQQKGEVVQRVLDGTGTGAIQQPMSAGLYYGIYFRQENKADLHVGAAEEEEQHATKAELRTLLQDIHQAMVANHAATGTVGTVEWHPTGAAVVKQVIELLGNAAGSYYGIFKAWRATQARKKAMQGQAKPDRKAGDMHPPMIPEHISYMQALRGKPGLTVKTRLMSDNSDYRKWFMDNPEATEEQKAKKLDEVAAAAETNMLANNDSGKARLASYQASLQDGIPTSLDINISHTMLPAIIAKLG